MRTAAFEQQRKCETMAQLRIGLAAALAVLVLLALSGVEAGDYRKGKVRKVIPESQHYFNHQPAPLLSRERMPKQFSWCDVETRDGRQNLCTASWNQHIPIYCGSCWAHGSLAMIQDRLKIKKRGRGVDTMLARQSLLNCAAFEGYGDGCDGGDVIDVLRYMTKFGLPDESCMTYNATDHNKYNTSGDVKHCPADAVCRNCMPINDVDTCWAVKTPLLYNLTAYGKVKGDDQEAEMMSEILQRGPITCSIATPDEFVYQYHSGIYVDTIHDTDVDHDIEVVGWGEQDGLKYWTIRNSWGTFWGELGGFFRLERGANALQIEAGDCWYAEPEFEMERDVEAGRLVGSMYGLIKAEQADGAPPAQADQPLSSLLQPAGQDVAGQPVRVSLRHI